MSAASHALAHAAGAVDMRAVKAVNGFAFDALRFLTAADAAHSSFISPLSLSQALCMALNGCPADSPTSVEMRRTLGLGALDVASVNAAHATLNEQVSALPGIELAIANSMWARPALKAAFQEAVTAAYRAPILQLTTREPINAWCSENTHGKITQIITDEIDELTRLIIVNAVYFKGAWKWKFDAVRSQPDQPFTNLCGERKTVTMMRMTRKDFRYAQTDAFQAIELPYGGDGGVVAHILLPPQGVTVGEFVQRVTHDEYARVCLHDGVMKASEGELHLPRFKIECSFAFSNALKALGMPSAFDDSLLPFTEVCADPCYISDVLHKTFVECNEEGTEAAAVTAVVIKTRCAVMQPVERFSMRCDRPFLFAISARKALLFVGTVDASASQ